MPLPPIDGFLGNYTSTKEGTNITFQCDEGYTPSMVMTTICDSTALWEPASEDHNCSLVTGKPAKRVPINFGGVTAVFPPNNSHPQFGGVGKGVT